MIDQAIEFHTVDINSEIPMTHALVAPREAANPAIYGNGVVTFADPGLAPMTRGQALSLKSLAIEAYQPKQFSTDLSRAEAARRIAALKQEIALADSF